MSKAIEEKNKALVLEAFETLFNYHDYVSVERYWSPKYIQHGLLAVLFMLPTNS